MSEKPSFALAVRAFIVDRKKLLVIKRHSRDVQMPGIWEPPGGRLEPGENPFEGLKREVREETGLEITVDEPLSVRHFTRSDGQTVTLLIFICSISKKHKIKLSVEHENAKWADLAIAKETIADFYFHEIDEYQRRFLDKK